jgi:hypothetical protein
MLPETNNLEQYLYQFVTGNNVIKLYTYLMKKYKHLPDRYNVAL